MKWKLIQSHFCRKSQGILNSLRMRNIVLTFSLVFCLAFASSSAKAELTQSELTQAILDALDYYNALGQSEGSFITYPTDDDWLNIATFLQAGNNGSPYGVGYFAKDIRDWIYYGLFQVDNNLSHPPLLPLILSAVQAGDTNLINFLRPVLAPSEKPNLYSMLESQLNNQLNLLTSIDSSALDILSYVPTMAGDVNSIAGLLSVVQTTSGEDNLGMSAIEVNDTETHLKLAEVLDRLDSIIAAIPSGGSDSSGDISDIKQAALDLRDTLLAVSGQLDDMQQSDRERFEAVFRDNARQASMDTAGIQVFDPLVAFSITNLYRSERKGPNGLSLAPSPLKDGIQVFDPYAKLAYQYNTNFWKGFVQNLVVGSGTNRAIRVVPGGSLASNLQEIASFYQPEDRTALDTNIVVVATGVPTNQVDNAVEEKALEDKSDELTEDFEKDVEDKQEDAQDAVDELVSTVDEHFDEIKEQLDPGQHEERLIDGLAPSTSGGSSKLLIWNAWEHSGISVPKLEIDFGDKRLENFRKRANLVLRSCYWLAFCLTAINLLRSLAIYLFSLGHVNEVAANALDAVGASGWQYQDASAETAKYVEWMASGGKKG